MNTSQLLSHIHVEPYMAKKRVFYEMHMVFNLCLKKKHTKEFSFENTRNGAIRAQRGFASSIEANLQKRRAKNMI
jgi:hypothetical protein